MRRASPPVPAPSGLPRAPRTVAELSPGRVSSRCDESSPGPGGVHPTPGGSGGLATRPASQSPPGPASVHPAGRERGCRHFPPTGGICTRNASSPRAFPARGRYRYAKPQLTACVSCPWAVSVREIPGRRVRFLPVGGIGTPPGHSRTSPARGRHRCAKRQVAACVSCPWAGSVHHHQGIRVHLLPVGGICTRNPSSPRAFPARGRYRYAKRQVAACISRPRAETVRKIPAPRAFPALGRVLLGGAIRQGRGAAAGARPDPARRPAPAPGPGCSRRACG